MISPMSLESHNFFRGILILFFIGLGKETLTKTIWWSARCPTKFQTSHSVTASEFKSFIALKYQSGTFQEFWIRGWNIAVLKFPFTIFQRMSALDACKSKWKYHLLFDEVYPGKWFKTPRGIQVSPLSKRRVKTVLTRAAGSDWCLEKMEEGYLESCVKKL